jgi:hypothetical protein
VIDPTWIKAGADVVGAFAQAATPAPAISGGGSTAAKIDNDFSGWTVSTGSSSAKGGTVTKGPESVGSAPQAPASQGISPVLAIAAAAALAWFA